MQRKRIWVKPGHDGWQVEEPETGKEFGRFPKKTEAVHRAKEIAEKSALCQVIVQNNVGRIETEYTYGEDPHEAAG